MNKPLADRFRPQSLDDIVGQKHLIGEGKPLRKIIESGNIPNLIFYGPSGVGKTTLATYIANKTNKMLKKLNGTTASTADIKSIVSEIGTFSGINGILLYLDEIQYFNKKQQQTLLEYIENGSITLIASTTENPYFYVYNAILSRSTVFEFKAITPADAEGAVRRALRLLSEREGLEARPEPEVVSLISQGCGGDVRKALNAVELLFAAARREISMARASRSSDWIRLTRPGRYLTLLVCSRPIRWAWTSPLSRGSLSTSSCTRFSPIRRTPASMAALTVSAGTVLVTAHSVTPPYAPEASLSRCSSSPRRAFSASTSVT